MKLVRFKKAQEKIAMGFLSYIPSEKMLRKLQETVQQYICDEHWQLFLYKELEDYIGLIGVEVNDEARTYSVQHVSLNPSFRGEGIGYKMLMELQNIYPGYRCQSTDFTEPFIASCLRKEEGADC
ncbi:GNAT family N-acetyltransferase [Sporosarcina sp. GW1-11]|uniref:GNAT family N-acetyltransferase n=1 Tax=Sporosarcina sp. GW1-11 TaxID=2899126 RepID=UPI00294C5A04|nr:GNAT family N-acetyltransferase [Sporosarcina sp. GW1-11]MDV6377636.1 GNAT family N-acetyltransferase [Sporosarcina sp. GW1-11]